MNGIIVNLRYAPPRIYCPSCGGIFLAYLPLLLAEVDLTCDFKIEVAWMVLTLLSKLTLTSVGNCIKAAHNRLAPNQSLRRQGLKKIFVDETSIACGEKYITVVYDMERS